LILDSFKVAFNIGVVLRLADALMLEKVYICGDTVVPPNKKIKTTSRGAERWVPWEYAGDAFSVATRLKESGLQIVSAELASTSVHYKEADYSFPLCLVLGREFDGVDPGLLAISDSIVHLPMLGMSNSINVSATASVLLYETYDQYRAQAPTEASMP
jgi:tRNA G18 (ribose-2'-O)-methylase SpoU